MRVDSEVDLGLPGFDEARPPVRRLTVLRLETPVSPHTPPVWTSRVSGYSLYEHDDALVLANDAGQFRIRGGEIDVCFEPFTVEARNYFLGAVMALWIELGGSPVLHAACVAVGEGALGLLGHSTTGKSTLAAGLVAAGGRLVSDDLLPLDGRDGAYEIYPSKASTRLWPDSARYFVGDPSGLARVAATSEKRVVSASAISAISAGPASPGPHPLRALYVLERTPEPTRASVEPLGSRDAFLALVSLCFAGEIVEHLPLRARRMHSLARAVRSLPVRLLRYPSGFDRVPEVCGALAEDFRGLAR
jgi:hypothetical protein